MNKALHLNNDTSQGDNRHGLKAEWTGDWKTDLGQFLRILLM